MQKRRIAIENTLERVSDYLSEKGYEVVHLGMHTPNDNALQNCDAIILAGQDENMMGMSNIKTESPVIDARGMTPEQIVNQLEQTFGNK